MSTIRILIADHAGSFAVSLRNKYYEADLVSTESDFLDYIQSSDYDAAILSIHLKGMDGIAVLKHLQEKRCKTPIIVVSNNNDPYEKIACLDAGADAYLGGAFPKEVLYAHLRAMTRRQSSTTGAMLYFGNISLNRLNFELSSSCGCICLRNKEFQVLELLMLHPNGVITLEQFIQNVWGAEDEPENHVVWICVSNLRKRLKALNANVEIRVKRNIGYFLHVID